MKFTRQSLIPISIFLISGLLFIPFLGKVPLFDWDEINFAEAAREMLLTKKFFYSQINFQPFWEKPPLFFIFQTFSMKMFGVNEFAARFPNAICGIFSLLFLYYVGKKNINQKFGIVWVATYACSLLPFFYFKSGIIDPWYNLFTFASFYFLFNLLHNPSQNKFKNIFFGAFFLGLSVLTKGPVSLLVVGLCVFIFWLTQREFKKFPYFPLIIYFFVAALIGSIWIIVLILQGNQNIVIEFGKYLLELFTTEDAGHGGSFFYHFIVLLVGCFPAIAFSISSMKLKLEKNNFQKNFATSMTILFWVVLLLFSITQTKIIHYSSLCYFPMSFLATQTIYNIFFERRKILNFEKWLEIIVGSLLSLVMIAVCFVEKIKPSLINSTLIDDDFAKENLKANVHWSGWEILGGIILFIGIVLFILYKNKNSRVAISSLFISSLIATALAIVFITPRVEKYSQDAALEFCRNHSKPSDVVTTIYYKSYANLFYANRQPHFAGIEFDTVKLKSLPPTDSIFCISKCIDEAEIKKQFPLLQKLYAKNGFVFYNYKRYN